MSGNLLARAMKRIATVGVAGVAVVGATLGTVEYKSRWSPSRALAAVQSDPSLVPQTSTPPLTEQVSNYLRSFPAVNDVSVRMSAVTRFARTFVVASLIAGDYKLSLMNKPKFVEEKAGVEEGDRRRLMHPEDHSASGAAAASRASAFEMGSALNPEYKQALDQCHARAAERLLWLALQHGGLYVKAAQHIASMNHVVPPEFIDTLSLLQVG